MKSFPLPNYLKDIMIEIHQIINIDKFILYGGGGVDLILDENCIINDLDIAIKGIDGAKISVCRKRIKDKGFKIIEPYREYFININKKVILIYAKNDKWFLDIGFLNNPKEVGQFDIESLYCRYPQLDYIDNFGALKAVRNKRLKPIRGLNNENPYMLLSRFLYLCAKYDINIKNNINHKRIILKLKKLLKNWIPSNKFHSTIAYTSCRSSIFKAILKAKDRIKFIRELKDLNILKIVFPELEVAINNLNKFDNKKLSKIKIKKDLILLFEKKLRGSDKKLFNAKIKEFKVRKWDKQDIMVTNKFKLDK